MTADGVRSAAGTYRPTAVADEGLAAKLGISLAYLRRLRTERPDLWDANINGWLHGDDLAGFPGDDRSFLIRLFQTGGDGLGVARAFLSDSYKVIDNLDALMATLDGIRQAGVDVQFDGLDLTERRLYARVVAPQVRAWAPVLLAGYRSPFGGEVYIPGRNWTPEQARAAAARDGRGYAPGAEPVLFAGLEIANSEVGDGAWTVTPRIVAQVCGNGMQIIADVARAVHLGARHEDGVVRYTADTLEKELALITARTRDAVATFLSPDYLQAAITKIERQAGMPVRRPEETVRAGGQDREVQRRAGRRGPGPLHPRRPADRRRGHAGRHQRRPDPRRRRRRPRARGPGPARHGPGRPAVTTALSCPPGRQCPGGQPRSHTSLPAVPPARQAGLAHPKELQR